VDTDRPSVPGLAEPENRCQSRQFVPGSQGRAVL